MEIKTNKRTLQALNTCANFYEAERPYTDENRRYVAELRRLAEIVKKG